MKKWQLLPEDEEMIWLEQNDPNPGWDESQEGGDYDPIEPEESIQSEEALWQRDVAESSIDFAEELDRMAAMLFSDQHKIPCRNSQDQDSGEISFKRDLLPSTLQPAVSQLKNPPPEEHPAEKRELTPYSVMRELLKREIIVVSGNAVYRFNGLIYQLLTKEDMERLIVARCREAVELVGTPSFIEGVYKCILKEPEICQHELSPNPDELVFLDGILNLATGKFSSHSPTTFATSYLTTSYRQGKSSYCPIFDQFIFQISNRDATLETRIWECLGYLVTQDQRGKCFVLFQGPPNSGKSVLGNFIRNCINREAVSSLDLHSFGKNFALADLIGKRLCIDLDLPASCINSRAVSFLKKLTGGDLLSTDIKYMPRVSFINTAKLLFATNHPILVDTPDEAFWQRLIVIPFMRSIPREQQDHELLDKFEAERSAIVAKALVYYRQLRANNYIFAGNFPPNIVCQDENQICSRISSLLHTHFEESEGEWTPASEILRIYCEAFDEEIPLQIFSRFVARVALSTYQKVRKKRKRVDGIGNPVSGFENLKKVES